MITSYFSTEDVSFGGWEESLKFNPFSTYQMLILVSGNDEYKDYESEVLSSNSEIPTDIIYTSYLVSKMYFEIDCLIEKDWK